MIFKDRVDAGKQLTELLRPLKAKNPVVLGLPRGGVPVAYEVAKALKLPIDVIIVRKLGVPSQPELAFGAIGENHTKYVNQDIIAELGVSQQIQMTVEAHESEEIRKRASRFRQNRKPIDIQNRTVIIVDDGIATGATIFVACLVAKGRGAREIIAAAPVATRESLKKLSTIADKCLVLDTPENFFAVGQWYEDFSTTTDEEVVRIMQEAPKYGD